MKLQAHLKWFKGMLFIALVLSVQLPALSEQDPPAEERVEPSKPVFTLVDAGAEPRATLRYSPRVAQAQIVTMSVNQTIRQIIDGEPEPEEPSPPMRFSMRFQVREVLPNGNFDALFDRLNMEVLEIEGMDRMEYAAARMSARRINGRSISVIADPRGRVLSATLYSRDGSESKDSAELASLRSHLDQISAAFPEEPIGLGARWTVETVDSEDGFTSVDQIEYRLAAVDGPRVSLDVLLKFTAGAQQMDLPELGDQKMMLEAMTGGGKGRIEVHLEQLAPRLADLSIDMEMKLSMEIFGEAMNIDQTASVRMSCTSEAEPVESPPNDQ